MRRVKYLLPILVSLLFLTGCDLVALTKNPIVMVIGVAFFVWLAFKMSER